MQRIKSGARVALLVAAGLFSAGAAAFDHPGGLHAAAQIENARSRIAAGAQPWVSAWNQLKDRADRAMNETPSAVRIFEVPGYGDDPAGHGAAKLILADDATAAYAAASAYAVGAGLNDAERRRYADKAVEILLDWAYTNTGYTGVGSPLLISYTAPAMIYAAEMLWNYDGWRPVDKEQMKAWTKNVVRDAAHSIKHRTNNWATWAILAALASDHLLDDKANWDKDVARLKEIIDEQIASDGGLPRELGRDDKSVHYTNFALESMTAAIELVRNTGGPNLYTWNPPSGGTVKKALEYFFDRGIENQRLWPTEISLDVSPSGRASELYEAMGRVYGVQKWLNWVRGPVFMAGTGLGFLAPTLFQLQAADAPLAAAPATPAGLTLEVR